MSHLMIKGLSLRVVALLMVTILVAAGCSSDDSGAHVDVDHSPIVTGELTVVDARVQAPIADAKTSAAYLTILNGLDKAVLLRSITTEVATSELHETVEKDGVLRMVPREDGFEIAAGAAFTLKPGSEHLMLTELNAPIEAGGEVMLTLNFDGAESLEILAEVVGVNGAGGDEADGHEHSEAHSDSHGEKLTLSQEIIDASTILDVKSLHAIDETLNDGGEIESAFVEGLDAYATTLNKIDWPDELDEMISELNRSLEELKEALAENELERAAELATATHDLAHNLEELTAEARVDEHVHD